LRRADGFAGEIINQTEDAMKKTVVLAVLVVGVLFVAFLAGCNTAKGVGKDVKQAGNAIEKASGK
jgi:predicted small secreted protein